MKTAKMIKNYKDLKNRIAVLESRVLLRKESHKKTEKSTSRSLGFQIGILLIKGLVVNILTKKK